MAGKRVQKEITKERLFEKANKLDKEIDNLIKIVKEKGNMQKVGDSR